ncbi:MAG TPA: ABC transporter substrate-binding protein [Tepidisphaeraceae bacterium]|jgi:ABC-type transport system substrate-binding protein|nr:ABC transporter substrate-binding protein [Tepidisphaeraceae bacterium]
MRKVKWIFFVYVGIVAILTVGLGVSLSISQPRDPQTLYSVYLANLKSLDPAVCNDTVGSAIIANIYECLYGYEYPTKPYKLIPQLAAEMPKVSEDGLTYTIKLKKGVRFYDPQKRAFPDGIGPEMKASDVIHSWKRVANFHLASPNYSTIFQDKIVGLDDFYAYTEKAPKEKVDYDRPVEGLKALDDYTVEIKLVRPAPQLRFQLAHGGSSVVSRKASDLYGEGLNKHPVGTGPYVMTQYLEDQRIIFEANPAYRGRPDVDGFAKLKPEDRLPQIKRVQFDYFREQIPAWLLFQQKYYDLLANVPKESFNQAFNPDTQELWPEMKAKGIKLVKTPEASMYYIGFNFNDKIVGKNKPLRQAMSMAHNRERYIKVYRNGRGIAMNGPIPPGFETYDANYKNPYTTFNLPAARALMEQAIRINGGPIPPMTMLMGDTDSDTRQWAEYLVSEWKEIGLNIRPEYNTWARFQELVDARETQIYQLGWAADYPDEQTYLMLFYGKYAPVGGVNSCAYVNPKYDELYEKASVMEPGPERLKLYREMIAIINEDCFWIHSYCPVRFDLQYDWLSDYVFMDYGGGYRQFLTLDVKKRQEKMSHR